MTDLRRKAKNAEKKTLSAASATILHSDVTTGANEIFEIPENVLITSAYCIPLTAGQSLLTVDLGYDGGAELGNDLDIDDTAVKGGQLSTALHSGTGKTVTATFSADPTAGEFVFVVEYCEYLVGNGCLTNYS